MSSLADPGLRRRRREQHSDTRSQSFIQALALPRDGSCWEIGAGLGSMARWLATEILSDGQVLATERRAEHVEAMKAGRPENMAVLRHDVEKEPPPSQTFDLIYARFVFEHLSNRNQILDRLASHLRPNGWLVIEDAIIDRGSGIEPPGFADALCAFTAQKPGSDYKWARDLPTHLRAAGLSGIRAQHVRDVFAPGTDISHFWASVLLQEATPGIHDVHQDLLEGETWFHGPVVVQSAGCRCQ